MRMSPGVRYMLVSTLGFTGMHVLIKSLVSFHVMEVLFFRSGVTAVFCFYFLRQQGISVVGKNQHLLLLRAFVGTVAMGLFFFTLQRIPLGAAVSLKYIAPVFTAVFAALFLRERVSVLQWFCFFLALVGVFLLKGFDVRIDTLSLVLGIAGSIFGGLVYVIIRAIGNKEHPLVIINYFMVFTALVSGLWMIPYWEMPVGGEWAALISIGALGYFGQVYMTRSLQVERASRVAPIKYMELVYSVILGFIWFGEGYTVLSLFGIVLILALVVPAIVSS